MTTKEIYGNFYKLGTYELYREVIVQILERFPRFCAGGLATGAEIAGDFDGFRASREYLASAACFDSMRGLARYLLEYTDPEVVDVVGDTYLAWLKLWAENPGVYQAPPMDDYSLGEIYLLVMLIDNEYLCVELNKEGRLELK